MRPAAEQLQPAAQPVTQGFRGEEVDPCGRELDRQRETVQSQTDLDDGGRVLVGESEVRPDCPGALDEELDCFVPQELRG